MNTPQALGIALTAGGALSAVLLESAGREARAAGAASVALAPGEPPAEGLARLVAALPRPAAGWARMPCALGLPLAALSLRRLHLPFADAAKRAQTFPFALEEALLVPAERVAAASVTLREDETGAELLACAVEHEDLRRLLAAAPGLPDPDIVCPAPQALAATLEEGGRALLLHGDAEAADLALTADGKLLACRHLPLDCPADGDAADLTELAGHLAAGIRQSLALFRQEGATEEPERLVLCGALAGSRTFAEALAAALGLPCVRPRARLRHLAPEYDAALACARLALRGRGEALNFRVGEFAKKSAPWRGRHPGPAWRWAAAALIAALVGPALLWAERRMLAAQSAALRADMIRVYKSAHPEVAVVHEPYMEMRTAVGSRGAALPSLFAPGRPGALALLADISGRIPADLPLVAGRLSLEPDQASLRGETGSFGEVDRLRALLAASPHFTGARILSSTAEGGEQGRVRFELRLDRSGAAP